MERVQVVRYSDKFELVLEGQRLLACWLTKAQELVVGERVGGRWEWTTVGDLLPAMTLQTAAERADQIIDGIVPRRARLTA